MLMASGFDKYFQVARCFRDEDDKGDRQPEFTQLDMEMAFVSQDEVIALMTDMLKSLVATYYPTRKFHPRSFEKITYKEVMEKYGTDKPDIRF
jgi:aspartyl-tRNA synthetase